MKFKYNKYYQKVSKNYNNLRLDRIEEIEITSKIVMRYLERGKRILEIGCGTGRYSQKLQEYGYETYGIDISEDQVKEAKKVINAEIANATDLPFNKNTFDSCLYVMVIHQFTNKELLKSLKNAKRVIKPKGIVIIKTRTHEDLKKRYKNCFFSSALDVNLKRYQSFEQIKGLLEDTGFQIIDKIETFSSIRVAKSDYINSVKNKYNTTLHLISETEFIKGLENLKKTLKNKEYFEKKHFHTTIIAKSL